VESHASGLAPITHLWATFGWSLGLIGSASGQSFWAEQNLGNPEEIAERNFTECWTRDGKTRFNESSRTASRDALRRFLVAAGAWNVS
jgi:hypothetical protein